MPGVRFTYVKVNLFIDKQIFMNICVFVYVDIDVPIFNILIYFTGTLLYLITAAFPAQIQFTKLKQSLKQLSLMMTARASRQKCAENYQVDNNHHIIVLHNTLI